ncbi:MAG: hypothetical protein JST54_02755 [Deltaproteobacteria bacterium]|nr:hypothetical protein [Deltaproteobacteria bacterium]
MVAALLAIALAAEPIPVPLQTKLAELEAPKKASVETVRAALIAARALDSAARPLLGKRDHPADVHRALARGWAAVEKLETALQVDGQGDGPERDQVRAMAEARAHDAFAIREWELAAAADAAPLVRVTRALEACWQEHLLSTDKPDAIDATATLTLEGHRVVQASFAPPLEGFRVHLAECLQTRLLGATVKEDADEVDVPLHFTAPRKDSSH